MRREVRGALRLLARHDCRARRDRGFRTGTTRPRGPNLRTRPMRDRTRTRTHGAATCVPRGEATPRGWSSARRALGRQRASRGSSTRQPSRSPRRSSSTTASRHGCARSPQACWRHAGGSRSPRNPPLRAMPSATRRGSSSARTGPRRRIGSLAASRRTNSKAPSTRSRPCSRGARPGTGAVRTGARRGREGGRREARAARAGAPRIPRATATSCSRTTPGWRRRSQRAHSRGP